MRISISVAVTALTLAFTAAPSSAQQVQVSLDGVTNAYDYNQLKGGSTHRASIRYDLTGSAAGSWGGSNGFKIYSPDGANWGYLTLQAGPLLDDLTPTTAVIIRHFDSPTWGTWNMTGNTGSDPAGGYTGPLSGAGAYLVTVPIMPGDGLQGGVDNGIAAVLEFETFREDANLGKHICIDTNGVITAWEWIGPGALQETPLWDNGLGSSGPRCWEIFYWIMDPPEWCDWPYSDMVVAAYGQPAEYQLCAFVQKTGYPLTYSMNPPYDDGSVGTVDPITGLWTLPAGGAPPGLYEIEFEVYDGVDEAFEPFTLTLEIPEPDPYCCVGKVGDANNSGDDVPTIGDVSTIVDFLFITRSPIHCLPEADYNQSGGYYPLADDITIGDISALVDCIFIIGLDKCELPDCLTTP